MVDEKMSEVPADGFVKTKAKKEKKRKISFNDNNTTDKVQKADLTTEEDTNNIDEAELLKNESNANEPVEAIAHKKKKKPSNHNYTISIAVPGSILSNAQNALLKSYLVGQIARAAVIFNIDEVIIFDDYNGQHKADCIQVARILQYLECPQYLRKYIFPVHSDLQYAGVLNPLDIPHHLRKTEMLPFREGIVINKPLREGERGCFVHVGLEKDVHINTKLTEGLRVTVKLDEPSSKKKKLTGVVVDPTVPKMENNIYWGYNVRIADSFNSIFTQCPFNNNKSNDDGCGYDVTIGTSDKGTSIDDTDNFQLKSQFQHLLIVFGGLHGLEFALENDESLNHDDVSTCFHHYLNTCPGQGSRTIRTEEAILITMARLTPIISSSQQGHIKSKKK